MTLILRSEDRGRTSADWLDSRHSFSFGSYRDPRRMGFGALRVLNEDRIAPGRGFATHGHRDMEIVTVMLDGSLRHADNLGSGATLAAGDVQAMTAGDGIEHSEVNPSPSESAHLLQIWIEPEARGLTPSYRQKSFAAAREESGTRLLVSPSGRDGSLVIHSDAEIRLVALGEGATARATVSPGRKAFLQLARGAVQVGGERLGAGDGAGFDEGASVEIAGLDPWSEALLFDLPA
jgi:redox-sensitive bicupin YhaK (pirin superfamily)